MKLTTKIVAGTVALIFLTSAAGSLQAQFTNSITLTMTASVQSLVTDNGTNTSASLPTKRSFATKDVLNFLALAKSADGKYPYPATNFPAGVKLVMINSFYPRFQVLNTNNVALVDVSDIISFTDGSYGNDIFNGKQNDQTGLANTSETDLHIMRIRYDDTDIRGNLGVRFYMIGTVNSTTTDTVPTVANVYTESHSHKLTGGVGEGRYQNLDFVLTGTLTASGKATLTLVP